MRKIVLLTVLALGCAGCTQDSDRPSSAKFVEPGAQAHGAWGSSDSLARAVLAHRKNKSVSVSFANLADRGDLVAYPAKNIVRRDGAYTWNRADISEAHAMRATLGGTLHITAPSGEKLDFVYERHVEHPSGDWTWIGKLKNGTSSDEAILTFGERAAFGSIAQSGGKAPLKLTVRDGVAWLVETDRSMIAGINNPATRPTGPDFLIPPKLASGSIGSQPEPVASSIGTAAAEATASTTVDVLLGYTSGFAAGLGGQSQAVTRLNNMVEAANQAYANSQVDARIRLVHAMQVNFADNTDNGDALEKLTGYKSGTGTIPVDPAFTALRAARDQYGADLVSLVRKFNTPENDGCGIAWLIGGGQSGIDSGDAPFGYSVVSDGVDAGNDGKNYFCRDETLAHELGHNMGSQHDRVTATENGSLKYGVYPYSFGYKTAAGAGNFYTVMAYGDSGQTSYRTFSNPRTTFCGGFACGQADIADNARSLGQTMPIVATFRATKAPQMPGSPDLYAISKQGGSGFTELHVLGGENGFSSFRLQLPTILTRTGTDSLWKFRVNDFNRDGKPDLIGILKQGASNKTEIHVMNGSTGFSTFMAQYATALHVTGTDDRWVFDLHDRNGDGALDLFAINRQGFSGKTEVHVLDGASGFQQFSVQVATILHTTGVDNSWKFELGDYNGDGFIDVYAIRKNGASGRTEVHVLNGATNYQSFIAQIATVLASTGSDNGWDFKLADQNSDGKLDLYALKKQGASNSTEVHVMNGADNFQTFLVQVPTVLHPTGTNGAWDFDVAKLP